ncbi:histidine phosphatase family protein [Solibacillus sp. FSL R7-0668]|uniref:histidine phosphatase family protein n=1 Tax=Solibacillus sp. FSL R7-0668 TaxID=2921688 RepID=UPI0030F950DD
MISEVTKIEICLVRHGETDWNKLGKLQGHTDIALNENGMKQAEMCAQILKGNGYELVLTSPLKRAKQTAQIIAQKNALQIIEMPLFIERNYGDAEGMNYEERITKFPNRHYPNQESKEILAQRIIKGLEQITEQHSENKIILVAHGAVINCILAILSNNEIGSGKTKLANACLSKIEYKNSTWTIKSFNEITHLDR